MFIFLGSSDLKVVVPANRIIKIVQSGSCISVYFDSGEFTYCSDFDSSVAPRVEKFVCRYSDENVAVDVIRAFYVSCRSGDNAFYF